MTSLPRPKTQAGKPSKVDHVFLKDILARGLDKNKRLVLVILNMQEVKWNKKLLRIIDLQMYFFKNFYIFCHFFFFLVRISNIEEAKKSTHLPVLDTRLLEIFSTQLSFNKYSLLKYKAKNQVFRISYESQTSGSQSLSLSPVKLLCTWSAQFGVGVDHCGQLGPCVNNSTHHISLSVIKFIFLKRRRKRRKE